MSDPAIRVVIRTPTSTRPGNDANVQRVVPNEDPVDEIEIEFTTGTVNSYQDLLTLMSLANHWQSGQFVVNNQPTELKRDVSVRLDVDSRVSSQSDLDKECSICQVKFLPNDRITTLEECNHTFHLQCLTEWGMYKQSCPLCRKPIPVLET